MMHQSPQAFSLVLDQQSPIAQSAEFLSSAKAHVVLQTVISGGLVLSDTQCLVAPNVARMLRSDGLVRELVRQKRILVALRDVHPGGEAVSSLSGLVGIHRDTAENAVQMARFVDDTARIMRWSTEAVSSNYTIGTADLFKGRFCSEEPQLASITHDFIEGTMIKNGGKLNRINLEVDFVTHLVGHNVSITDQVLQKIKDCSSAFYYGSIPSVLGLDAVYNEEHQRSIEHKLGTVIDLSDSGGEFVESALDLTKLVEGLANLPIDEVVRLAESREAQEYRRLVASSSVAGNEHDVSEIVNSLQLLNYRMDEAILEHTPSWRVPKASRGGRIWRKQVSLFGLGVGSAAEVASLSFG